MSNNDKINLEHEKEEVRETVLNGIINPYAYYRENLRKYMPLPTSEKGKVLEEIKNLGKSAQNIQALNQGLREVLKNHSTMESKLKTFLSETIRDTQFTVDYRTRKDVKMVADTLKELGTAISKEYGKNETLRSNGEYWAAEKGDRALQLISDKIWASKNKLLKLREVEKDVTLELYKELKTIHEFCEKTKVEMKGEIKEKEWDMMKNSLNGVDAMIKLLDKKLIDIKKVLSQDVKTKLDLKKTVQEIKPQDENEKVDITQQKVDTIPKIKKPLPPIPAAAPRLNFSASAPPAPTPVATARPQQIQPKPEQLTAYVQKIKSDQDAKIKSAEKPLPQHPNKPN